MGALICSDCGRLNTFRDSLCTSCGRFLVTDRPLKYQRPAGPPWALFALFSLVALVGLLAYAGWCESNAYRGHAMRTQARCDTVSLKPVAEKYVVDHPDEGCPTPGHLRAVKELSQYSNITDPWSTPYVIDCTGADLVVRSAGPDRKLGTRDDIDSTD